MESDNVKDTLDYAAVYRLVQREMAVPSQLLEHVAGRIVSALQNEFPQIMSIDLWLTKVTPPMGGDCEGAGVELHLINDKTD
jgi:dihydroneopterin aldolase